MIDVDADPENEIVTVEDLKLVVEQPCESNKLNEIKYFVDGITLMESADVATGWKPTAALPKLIYW